MKARQIKKLRKKIEKFHRFSIRDVEYLGGSFEKESHIFTASDWCHAVKRYLSWYCHKHRRFHRNHTNYPEICFNDIFARFEVHDIDKNFTYYVR